MPCHVPRFKRPLVIGMLMLTHPIPNMTTPCIGVILEVLIQSKELGISRANAVTNTTTIVMLAAMIDDIL